MFGIFLYNLEICAAFKLKILPGFFHYQDFISGKGHLGITDEALDKQFRRSHGLKYYWKMIVIDRILF